MTTETQLLQGWNYVSFDMFFNVLSISDKKISQKEYLQNGKYPVIDQGSSFIGGYSNNENLILKINRPVIVFGDHTKCFKYIPFSFIAGADGVKVLEPKNNIDPKYAYYYCLSVDLFDRGYSRHFAFLKKSQFLIVPDETQQAIVNKIESLFAEIDAGIASLKTAQQQLKHYRQSLLKNAFNGELTKQWRLEHADRLPSANELLAQIQAAREQHHAQQLADWQTAVKQWEQTGKQGKKPSKPKAPTQVVKVEEDLEDLPNEWIWGKLSDLGELARGKSKHRPRNDKKLFGGKYPFIQTGEVRAANRVIQAYEQTYSEFGLEQSKLWKKGTLCITIAANIAETAFLGFDACFPDSIVGFSALKAVSPEYIELFIKSVRTQIEAYAPATGQKNINLNTVENLIVPYCSVAEQTQIVAILESKLTACDQLASELATQLKQAELLKQAVLKSAFSGSLLDK